MRRERGDQEMNWKVLRELQERAGQLSVEERLYLIERLAASLRREHFTDHEALERSMAVDEDIQFERLKADIQIGIDELDCGQGQPGEPIMAKLFERFHRPLS
jgi:hypothetical protein